MPCRGPDNYEIAAAESSGLKSELRAVRRYSDIVTRNLCRILQKVGVAAETYLDEEGMTWWVDHKELDRQRQIEEDAKEEQRLLKEKALSKLTKEEKKALGIKDGR